MESKLAARMQRIKPSPTMAVAARAAGLKAAGRDIIDLGAGEPDFDTPDAIKAAAIAAIGAGQTKYTAVDGTPALKAAIIDKFARDNGLEYMPAQILVSAGGKQSFYNLVMACLGPGDEAVIPAPYWTSYPDMVKLSEANPVIVSAGPEQRFRITPRQLEAALTPRTRLVVVNSPGNPTGAVYSGQELAELAEVLLAYPKVLVASDDIYEKILYTRTPFQNILNVCPALYDRTVVINGVSKAYAMTGWRIGYAAGPEAVIQGMKKVQSQSTSNPCSVSQAAAVAALSGDQACVEHMREAFQSRHDAFLEALNRIPGIHCLPADGAFYLFPEVSGLMESRGLANDVALAEALLEETGVAAVPGSAFGAAGFLRLSYAASAPDLKAAGERLARFATGAGVGA